jgi:C1A family cysteine protease
MPSAAAHVDLKFAETRYSSVTPGNTVDLRRLCSPVENQWHVGSCVANAIVGALEMLKIRDTGKHTELSRLFLYYNSRLMHRAVNVDKGTYIRLAMGTLAGLGTCTEAKWSYDPARVNIRPSWGSYREAFPHKIDKFYSIDADGDERTSFVKKALESIHPVVFGMSVDQAFMSYAGGVLVKPTGDSLGRHAMMICGYNDNEGCFTVRNSWGTGWGEEGYVKLAYDYFDEAHARDFWVPTMTPVL